MIPFTRKLNDLFQKHANRDLAIDMSRYMRNQFIFFGIKAPLRKALLKDFIKKEPMPTEKLEEILVEMWSCPEREIQYVAIDLLERSIKVLPVEWISILEYLVVTKSWWDTVDPLAALVGELFRRFPDIIQITTRTWMDSGNLWLQRVCLIFQKKYKSDTDWELLKKYILELSDSYEFFIQKGAGWALREYSKTYPKRVLEFVSAHTLPGLTRKEALKRMGN